MKAAMAIAYVAIIWLLMKTGVLVRVYNDLAKKQKGYMDKHNELIDILENLGKQTTSENNGNNEK